MNIPTPQPIDQTYNNVSTAASSALSFIQALYNQLGIGGMIAVFVVMVIAAVFFWRMLNGATSQD